MEKEKSEIYLEEKTIDIEIQELCIKCMDFTQIKNTLIENHVFFKQLEKMSFLDLYLLDIFLINLCIHLANTNIYYIPENKNISNTFLFNLINIVTVKIVQLEENRNAKNLYCREKIINYLKNLKNIIIFTDKEEEKEKDIILTEHMDAFQKITEKVKQDANELKLKQIEIEQKIELEQAIKLEELEREINSANQKHLEELKQTRNEIKTKVEQAIKLEELEQVINAVNQKHLEELERKK